ncbi:MAG: His/Gly/Thr/Pro-type tRNA ligase C-terminal domain-containing protein, partial [Rhodospirillales bacterium]|nr:His/Gly/Thr/Pro-type tRNA ligase C-terminal domain-containing protein [Rhodospirillales bacterium]
MLHRALFGSLERFIGILLENYSGHLPLWLSPTHAVVATITDQSVDYAKTVTQRLQSAGLRVGADLRNEKIGYKVREHSAAKIPLILAVGAREAEQGTVSLRRLGSRDQEILALDEAVTTLCRQAASPIGRRAAEEGPG